VLKNMSHESLVMRPVCQEPAAGDCLGSLELSKTSRASARASTDGWLLDVPT
jgi:hypothetical protein